MNYLQKTATLTTDRINKYWLALIAIMILPISGISIDIFVPSLPAISQHFATTKSLAQLTITMYMLGLGVAQLFSGIITDSFGRKKPFLLAMFFFIIATLWIPWSHSIYELLILRLIQGIMVALFIVPLRSIIPDLFSGNEFYKMTTYSTIAWSIGPIIAPAIGGYLQHYFGWESSFYFVSIYSIVAFLLILFYMPETSTYRHPLKFCAILKRYREILLHREFFSGFMINGALYSLTILFAAVGAFLLQKVLHYSAVQFGYMALLTGAAWFLGTIINRIFIHIPAKTKLKYALWSMLGISLVSLIFVIALPMNIYTIMTPIALLLLIGGVIFPNNFARAISLFPQSSGSANALFASFIFLIPALSSALGTLLKSTSIIPLSISYVGIVIFCLVMYYVGHGLKK